MTTHVSVARRWFEARKLQKLGITDAALKIGIPLEALAAIEHSGDLRALSEEQLRLAAAAYDVSVGFLLGK